jgi:hypothetical protein
MYPKQPHQPSEGCQGWVASLPFISSWSLDELIVNKEPSVSIKDEEFLDQMCLVVYGGRQASQIPAAHRQMLYIAGWATEEFIVACRCHHLVRPMLDTLY